jgi:hypothetical protein
VGIGSGNAERTVTVSCPARASRRSLVTSHQRCGLRIAASSLWTAQECCPVACCGGVSRTNLALPGPRAYRVQVTGLDRLIATVNAEDKLLIVDDVFDTGNTIKTVIETIRSLARRNSPEIRTACLYYKPTMNKTDITPEYFLKETAAWLVFPHELEGLTHAEVQQKWDPAIAPVVDVERLDPSQGKLVGSVSGGAAGEAGK